MDLQALKSALSDNEVIQAFAAALLPTLLTSIENKFAVINGIVDKLRHDVDSVLLENDDLRTRLDTLGTENVTLRSCVEALEGDLAASTSNRLDALESYTRVDNLIIKGLPENYAEITYSTASSTDETTKRPVMIACWRISSICLKTNFMFKSRQVTFRQSTVFQKVVMIAHVQLLSVSPIVESGTKSMQRVVT